MAIAPKFEANISADISRFMRNMATVDKKIRDAASGVVIDIRANISDFMSNAATVESTIADINRNDSTININGNISDLQRAIAEANAGLAGLNNNPTVNINGNSSNFNNAVNNVNRQTNTLSRRITEARIGANIGGFESRMVEVTRALTEADDTVTPQIELEITQFTRKIDTVQRRMREIARSTADPQVEADIAGFMSQMAAVQAQLDIVTREHDIDIRVDAGGASARIAALWLQIKALTAKDFIVGIQARWANYQAVMGAMAAFSRNFSEIAGTVGRGLTIAISPAIVPILASVVGLLGNLGPMLGTIAGSSFALVGAFAAAGFGVAGFAAVAIPSISGVIKTSKELRDIEAKIANADTWKEKNKLMKEQQTILDGMSKSQIAAGDALNIFKSNYAELVKAMEGPVLKVFASGLTAITGILTLARPMIRNVTEAMGWLMDALNRNLESQDVKDFFTFLAKSAAPALLTVGKAVGNFMMGLFNMFTAFAPLSVATQNGFLAMSESFRTWAAGLGESKKFKAFIDYTKENMPKIRSIFSDAIQGMINMFGGFSGSSSDMMTSLQSLMERFKEWSSTISQNQGFQKFIDYIKTNGPVVVSTIGEIVTFITNLGIAAAPMGEKMLGIINSMIDFTNSMLKAHPWLGKLAVGAVVLSGAFLAAMPILVGLNSLTGGFITTIIKLGVKFALTAARMAAGWIVAMGPIGWITIAVVALAVLIYKYWDEISAWTKKAWSAVSTAVTAAVDKIMSWISEKFPGLYDIIQTYMSMAKDLLVEIWSLIKGTFSNALAWLKALVTGDFQGMKDAASDQMSLMKESISKIWSLVKENYSIILSKIKAIVQEKFEEMKAAAIEKMIDMANKVVGKILLLKNQALAKWIELKTATLQKIDEMKEQAISYFVNLASQVVGKVLLLKNQALAKWLELKVKTLTAVQEMKDKVVEFFTQIKEKISSKMSEAKTALSNKWEEAKSATSSKLANLVSSVGTFFSNIVSKVREKLGEAVRAVGEFIGQMPGKVLSFVGDMVSAGASLVGGVISGIKSKISEGLGVIGGLATSLISRFKRDTDTHSPSRAFAAIAEWFAPGIVRGVDRTSHLAVNSISRLAASITDAFNPQLSMAGVSVNRSSIDAGSQMDQLSAQVRRELAIDMTVNHSGSVDGGGNASAGDTYYVTIDAKNVKEFNDVVRLLDRQEKRRR